MKIKALIFTSVVTFILNGCMSMPISTMYKMSQFSPLDIKPHELKVAIRTNEAINIQSGAVQISMDVQSKGMEKASGISKSQLDEFGPVDIALKMNVRVLPENKKGFTPILLDDIGDDERLTILSLSDEDAQSMSDTLALVRKYRANGIKPRGSFGISTQSQCFGDFSGFDELEVDVFIQVDNQEGYIMFLEDIDIIEEANDRDLKMLTTNKCE
ncbi:hypothetical protein KO525_16510 [Psychrosphaera sp. B3R10]|uniref:hypothetical protein n=1 Tax=unclassified Psychrosphaera TaxID=2641570 RepID=UPI001C0825D3|nr:MULTISPECIES: hypothetical protein [unclassified Psychrosphaera]MBU2880791.1 hypothetical protein [Psychrosphaera sp. I2R16]MBU2990990.1 hypothetical protein [Psychrosphaera sp. B3R10]